METPMVSTMQGAGCRGYGSIATDLPSHEHQHQSNLDDTAYSLDRDRSAYYFLSSPDPSIHGPPPFDSPSSSWRRLFLSTCLTLAVALSIRSAFTDRITVVHRDIDTTRTTHADKSGYNNKKGADNKERIYRINQLSSHHHAPIKNPVELYFHDQIVNHFDDSDTRTYSQRYYQDDSFWAGPSGEDGVIGGSPIFVVHGGEDAIDGTLYPFVSQHLAQRFGALTICIEHRFYGTSQPVAGKKKHHHRHHHHGDSDSGGALVSNEDFKTLLQRRQALADAARLIQHVKDKMGCGAADSEYYCPVMTIGGSYPGENAALMRIVHPDVVDIGYASSAPFVLSILHQVNQDAYYDKVTQVADEASPGCAMAVKTALLQIMNDSSSSLITTSSRRHSLIDLANALGICLEDVPGYIQTRETLIQEVNFIVATHFAGYNMDYYPPGPDTDLVQACEIFQDDTLTAYDKVRKLLPLGEEDTEDDDDQDDDDYDDDDDDAYCFDLSLELPPGPGGRISAADWSGVGGDHSGYIWDFQSCVFSVEIGMSNASMFPRREWTLEWQTGYCQNRFDYTPVIDKPDEFNLAEKLPHVSRLLLVNGMNDGWSVGCITNASLVADSSRVINMEHGAHHSDLSHTEPSEDLDTADVQQARIDIANQIGQWLDEIRAERQSMANSAID